MNANQYCNGNRCNTSVTDAGGARLQEDVVDVVKMWRGSCVVDVTPSQLKAIVTLR